MNELLKQLIRTAPTLENGEQKAANVLADYFHHHSIPATIDTWDENRANVTASIGSQAPDAPVLLFGAHLDVVPASSERWKTDPFEPVEKDNKLYGRGTVDMLGGLCAAAEAMVQMKDAALNGRVIFAATAGEETDSCGVMRFVKQNKQKVQNPIGVIITEPTGMEIKRAHRGILWLKLQTLGKTAHGSMPHLGINAVLKMNELVNRLKNWQVPHTLHPLLGGCSVSLNRIQGGSATNIIPDSCTLEMDIRTLPNQDHQQIIQNLQVLCDDIQKNDPDFKADISIIREVEAMETPSEHPFIKQVCQATGIHEVDAAGFTTDGPHFAELCDAILIIGPGDGSRCHKPDEYIETAALEDARQMYKHIIQMI